MATQVTTAATKTISSKSPYIGTSFQTQTKEILGRDGFLSGGSTSDNGVAITVEPFKFVSRGIIGETLANSVVDVPTSTEPWYIVASMPDDDPDSGVIITATASLAFAASGVVIAAKVGGVWRNPAAVDVAGAAKRATEPGAELGFSGFYKNTGDAYTTTDGSTVVDEVMSNRGIVVTPEGSRIITDALVGESAKHLSIVPPHPSFVGDRADRIVLRQRESFSTEIAYLVGGVSNTGTANDTPLGTGDGYSHFYTKRDGTFLEQWMIWGNGADFHNYGSYGDVNLFTGGATLGEMRIAGQRSSDDALVAVYVDGISLRMVAFSATTGAIATASVSLEGLANAVTRVRATMDKDENVLVVFEYDDGTSPSQQIYYGKFSSAAGSFGVAAQAAQYLEAANSGFNDTKPDIKVCRNGISHVIFIRGTGTDEFGNMRYVRLDPNGTVIDATDYSHATQVGVSNAIPELGIDQTSFDEFELLALTVTPHDEVYAAVGVRPTGQTTPKQLLLFSPSLEERTGYPFIRLSQPGLDGVARSAVAIAHGDGGELYVSSRSSLGDVIVTSHLDTQPGRNGIVDFILATSEGGEDSVANSSFGVLNMESGPNGVLAYVYDKGTSDINWETVRATIGGPASLHTNDLLLQTINITQDFSGTLKEEDVEIFQARKKTTVYPPVVGDHGDYQGYGGLQKAIDVLSAEGGGTVVLRSGVHKPQGVLGSLLSIPYNVSIVGDQGAIIDGSVKLEGKSLGSFTMYGNVLEDSTNFTTPPTPGAWIELVAGGGTGWHRIEKVLRTANGSGVRLVLSDGIGGVTPVGTNGTYYASGLTLKNLTILGDFTTRYCRQCIFQNISVVSNTATCESRGNYQCIFDNIDFTQAASSGVAFEAGVINGEYNVYKNLKFSDVRGKFLIDDLEQYPTLIGCKGDESNSANVTYDFATGRTTPAEMIGCEGRFAATSLDQVVTNVGKKIRAPEGLGPLQLADDNTRAGGGDLAVSLTGASAVFNGATAHVITDSVNERVKKSGDTMSGNLTTDATTRTIGDLGGVAGTRFNVGANLLNALGLITAQAGLTAAVNQHVTVSGTGRYKHGTMTLVIPAVAARDGLGGGYAIGSGGIATANSASDDLVFPVILPIGVEIIAARCDISPFSTGTKTFDLRQNSGFTAGTSIASDTTTSGAPIVMDVGVVAFTMVAGTSVFCEFNSGDVNDQVKLVEIDYRYP